MNDKKKTLLFYNLEFIAIAVALLYCFQRFSLVKSDDGLDQYYPVFVYCGKYIREVMKGILHGQFHFKQFDFSIGMGEGVIPTLNYYGFGDPFMLFSALVPVAYSAYAYTVVILIKMYVSGLCFIYYCRKRNISEMGITAGVPFYIVNNYLFYSCFSFPTYQSVLISLPLICAGLDEVIQKKSCKKKISIILILAVAYQALYGFYLLYMELLFAAVYALVELLCNIHSFKRLLGEIGILFGHIVIGLMTGGIILFPAIFGYINSSRSESRIWFGWKTLLQLGRAECWEAFCSLILPANYTSIGIIVPILAIFSVILAMKEKSTDKDLKVIFFLMIFAYLEMKLTSYVAGGFSPDFYYNRWMFCLVFLIAVLTSIGVEKLYQLPKKGWIAYVIGCTLYYVALILIEQKWFSEGITTRKHLIYLVYWGIVIVSAIFFACAIEHWNALVKGAISVCMIAFVIINITTLFGSGGTMYGTGVKWYFKMYDDVRSAFLSSNVQLYNTKEDVFSRKDIRGNSENESIYIGHYGTRAYYSIINNYVYNFYKGFAITTGLNGSTYHVTGLDSRSGLEDLLAVRYYDDVKKDSILENENYLPFGFGFDKYYLEKDAEEISEIARNANVLDAVILNKPVVNVEKTDGRNMLWEEENFELEYRNIEFDDKFIIVNPDSKIVLTVDSKNGGECYFYTEQFHLRGTTAPKIVYFEDVACTFRNTVAANLIKEQSVLICLGNVDKGKTTFEISFTENAKYTIDEIHIYTIDVNAIEYLNQKRQMEILEDICIKDNKVTGSIKSSKSQILFLNVPYGAGWKAYLDGEEREILRADYGFMALELEEGNHTIELRYFTPGLKEGIICSIIGILLIFFLYKVKNKYLQSED